MTAGAKLAAFGAGLVLAFGVGAAVGAAVGPIDVGGESDTLVTAPDTSSPHPAPGSEPTSHEGHG
jgi:hypothetical protein